LRGWVRQAERDQGKRAGPTSDDRERIKALEREVRELRQANEILRRRAEIIETFWCHAFGVDFDHRW
jgi:transposase-like protein